MGGLYGDFARRWVAPGTHCAQTISFTDMLATFAAVAGKPLAPNEGEDSYDLVPLLLGQTTMAPLREATVMESSQGILAIRLGVWKLIPHLGSGGFTKPATQKPAPGDPAGQLYNLADDPGETKNLYAEQAQVVQRLTALLEQYKREPSVHRH
jgi:arylsulfatase A-like enzyme